MSKAIFGLDIGTSSVKGVVWRPGRRGGGQIVAQAEHPVETGIQRGIIRDVEDVASRVGHCIDELEQASGERLSRGIVSVGGIHLESRLSKGSVIVSRSDRLVSFEDMRRAIDMSKDMVKLPNRDVIHVIPRSWALDDVGGIQDPEEMEGRHLDADTFVIDGLTPALGVLEKTLELADVRPELTVAAPLAGARAALSKRDRDEGAVAIDIGGSTTSLAVFEEDTLHHVAVLPHGSYDVTKDIALALKLPIEVAEGLKRDVASALSQGMDKRDMLMLSRYSEGAEEEVSKRYIAEIIEAKVEEIFDFIADEMKKAGRLGKLAAGAVLYGGGAKLRGIETVSKKALKMTSRTASLDHEKANFADAPGLQFFNACGLILWGLDEAGEGFSEERGHSAGSRVKNFFRLFLP